MNQIVQHIPPMVETGSPPESGSFSTVEELEQIPFVKRFMEIPGFFRLAQNDGYLIMESHEGRHWWVLGRMAEAQDDLPEWRPIYRLKDEHGNVADYEGSDVRMSCGDDVTMKDGRVLTWVRER